MILPEDPTCLACDDCRSEAQRSRFAALKKARSAVAQASDTNALLGCMLCGHVLSQGFINDLPVGVFPNYFPVPEFPVIASTYLNSGSVGRRAG